MSGYEEGMVDVLDVVVGRVLGEIRRLDEDPALSADAFVRERYRGSRRSANGAEVVRLEVASGVVTTVVVRGLRADLVIEVQGRRRDVAVPEGRFADALLRFVG